MAKHTEKQTVNSAPARRDRDALAREALKIFLREHLPSRAIGERLGVSRATIDRWLQEAAAGALTTAGRSAHEMRAEELARLSGLETAAWSAFEKSMTPLEPAGDAKFLSIIGSTSGARRQLLGLDRPKEPAGGDGASLEASVMPDLAQLVVRILSDVGAPPEALERFLKEARVIILRIGAGGGIVDLGGNDGDEDPPED